MTALSAPLSDYSPLLIQAADIVTPNDTFTMPAPPTQNPNGKPGVEGLFRNTAGTRKMIDTILLAPNPLVALQAMNNAAQQLSTRLSNPAEQPTAVGGNGTAVSGTTSDGSQAVMVLLVTEGRAVVIIEFDSAPDDPVPVWFVTDVGQKQHRVIMNNLWKYFPIGAPPAGSPRS